MSNIVPTVEAKRGGGGPYAKTLVQCGYPYEALPELDLKGRHGTCNDMDFIDPSEMSSNVMMFVDKFQRPGVALHLSQVEGEHKGTEVVLALFQRHKDDPERWSFSWGPNDCRTIEDVLISVHRNIKHEGGTCPMCADCPIQVSGIHADTLAAMMQRTHSHIHLLT